MMSTSRRASLLALAGLLAFAPEAAADVYKVVTPDGRVTYTDHPPVQPGARTTVVSRRAATGALVMPPPLSSLLAAPVSGHDSSRRAPPAASGASGAMPPDLSREVVESLIAALGRREAVDAFRTTCVRAEPVAATSFEKASQDWRMRNAAVLAQADRILEQAFDPARRSKLEADAHTRALPLLEPLATAVPAAQAQWCEGALDELEHRLLDLAGSATASPLLGFSGGVVGAAPPGSASAAEAQ